MQIYARLCAQIYICKYMHAYVRAWLLLKASITYVLSVTEGAGQHAARVEPYAGLRMNMLRKCFKMFQNVEKMFLVSKV